MKRLSSSLLGGLPAVAAVTLMPSPTEAHKAEQLAKISVEIVAKQELLNAEDNAAVERAARRVKILRDN